MCFAQEHVTFVDHNPFLKPDGRSHAMAKTTALSLPFFDDFTNYDLFPDASKWVDMEVYVNNTMGVGVVSRGVATFDALNKYGIPYDTISNTAEIYADSLTSRPIDLLAHSPADSIYFSFFYQPQGNGFSPETDDSLMLFMLKKNGIWTKVWSMEGTTLQPFQVVMIPIVDTSFFYSSFQFRFVNKASINTNDDVWNIDYVKLDAFRNIYDTLVSDVGFGPNPTYILNDYTFMPYHQFSANMAGELAAQHSDSLVSRYTNSVNVTYSYTVREELSNTPMYTGTNNTTTIQPLVPQGISFPMYPISYSPPSANSKVVFENKYFIQSISTTDPTDNDTIVCEQIFDNYLAYDDGTAEQSYYLNLFPTLPGKLAIEYHLNQPDTLRGVAIYFGRQVPTAWYKTFSLVVYSDIGVTGSGTETLLDQEDDFTPKYIDTINHFWYYSLHNPVALPAGVFYVGTIQPALSGSDSLYFGLDVNRVGGNHLYYNTLNTWQPSTISGALMLRPLFGQFTPSTDNIRNITQTENDWSVSPNPVFDKLTFSFIANAHPAIYQITDLQGKLINTGQIKTGQSVDLSDLPSGMYFVRLIQGDISSITRKIIKQ